ncbi:phospholipase A-2-activating protein [Cephus cinctus]|uniref:Phospholipase A-2-activating protein n=1 Tax=Cephus cinctus TaxID=211228 RepID=A0AAJ7C3V3_CEPCN|nr:phospholipase A-2-activating protein [Cephus cinctus]
MAKAPYKLSCILVGHTSDVRALATCKDGSIVSASRDNTARVWKPTGNGSGYSEDSILKGHVKFVSSVCVINPSEQYAKGFIITGSNDNNICIYIPGETEPIHKIKAHENTVCNLRTGSVEGTFLSSSWDLTAKLWHIKNLDKPLATIVGHTAAVWCVADLPNSAIVTGSADKLVMVWSRESVMLHELSGHTDCVRDISIIKNDEFLTCANDATIRHWSATQGVCLGTYCGHENYIYSIVSRANGTLSVTGGEDHTVRVWYNGEIDQTIMLPTQSVWCVDLLPNGDIVTGASDGQIRIFSANPERYADTPTMQHFEEAVAQTMANAQLELGGIKISELPDSKVLSQPGQKDGQTKMVREGDVVRAYSWSQSLQKWERIGDVMGASGGSAATSGKQLYNGIEYDFVFSVDIQDGVPPLKLPYNIGEDPWHVAQKFIHDNGLSQLFLDQVASFIVKNSQSAPVVNTNSQYADPFTGGSRYVPGASTSNNSVAQPHPKLPATSTSKTSVSQSYIPHVNYLKLEQANHPAILEKLRELNKKCGDSIHRIPEDKLELIVKLASESHISDQLRTEAVELLRVLLNWPNEMVFPALDVARLAVLHGEANSQLCTAELLEVAKRHIKNNALPSNQMLTFRLLANMFCHEKGEKLGLKHRDELLKAVLNLSSLGSKNNQVAISTYLLNLIVALNKHDDTPGRTRALNVLFTLLPLLNEPEAVFRALVGLGTLLAATSDPDDRNELIRAVRQSETALNVLRTMSESITDLHAQNKLANCSKQIIDLII